MANLNDERRFSKRKFREFNKYHVDKFDQMDASESLSESDSDSEDEDAREADEFKHMT